MRTVDERYPSAFGGSLNRFANLDIFLQLVEIPTAEFVPSPRIVPEPLPQSSTWSNVFQPGFYAQVGFSDSTRPKPLDEETLAIFRGCLVVNTLELNHFRSPLRISGKSMPFGRCKVRRESNSISLDV